MKLTRPAVRPTARAFLLGAASMIYAPITQAQTANYPAFPAPEIAPMPQSAAPLTSVNVTLKGYVFGIKLLNADFITSYSDTDYNAYAKLKTSGIGALLKGFHIWAATEGRFSGSDLKPISHLQQNTNKKNRRVEMDYSQTAVGVSIVPGLGSYGKPPASEAERFAADDTLSALLNIMMRGTRTSSAPCNGDVPVFDSKQHYILRLENVGVKKIRQKGFSGNTIVCHAYYIPVSGFDPEDLPSAEEQQTPVTLYMGHFEQAGLYIPVKMKYKVSGFNAVIKARYIEIIEHAPGGRFQSFGESFDAQEARLKELGYIEVKD